MAVFYRNTYPKTDSSRRLRECFEAGVFSVVMIKLQDEGKEKVQGKRPFLIFFAVSGKI